MKNYKKFVITFIVAICLFVLFHLIVWVVFDNKKLLSPPAGQMVGDLGRTSYSPKESVTRPCCKLNLPKLHEVFNGDFNQDVDVLTFGDSFSIGGGGGENPYYQDYIATYNDLNVVHVNSFGTLDPVPTLISFINMGYLDKIKPKYVLLECVERKVLERLSKEIDFNFKFNKNEFIEFYNNSEKFPLSVPRANLINLNNYKFVLYNILYNFDQKAFIATAHRMKTNKFKTDKDFILVHKREISYIKDVDVEAVKKINSNLNRINEILSAKGVKFYFMLAPDKYDLYYKFFKKPYGINNMFALLRQQNKKYNFIDTKKILTKELDKGRFGIYHFDDTHWCNKASESIFKEVNFE